MTSITRRMRTSISPPLPPIDDIRSAITLAIYSLLIAFGAQQFPAGEAYQFVGFTRAVNGTHQCGRVIESPPVFRLAEPDAHWRECDEQQVEKGAHSRDQRDEQDTLDDDCCHISDNRNDPGRRMVSAGMGARGEPRLAVARRG